MTRVLAAGVSALVLLILTACVPGGGSASTTSNSALPESVVAPLVAALPERAGAITAPERLAEGLTPPTNRWFSGLVFGEAPLPVFPLPLSFGLTPTGFQFGLPTVKTVPGSISAPFAPDVHVDAGADANVVTAFDEVSVTVSLSSRGDPVSRVTIARGSPIVSYVADAAHDIHSSVPLVDEGAGLYSTTVGENRYGLVAPNATLAADGMTLALPAGSAANWFAVPADGQFPELAVLATDGLTGVSTSFDGVMTTLAYRTEAGGDTLFGALPHQAAGLSEECALGSYSTVYGAMELCSGSALSWSVPEVDPKATLDLGGLDDAQSTELLEQLQHDIALSPEIPADTYFGGKELARLANLLQIARELGADAEITTLTDTIVTELRLWTDPAGCDERAERCFVYDPELRGVVGLAASFGSEEFNDHHFHYGYFLYAAGVVAAEDPDLAAEFSPVMTLLAADIASGETSASFPVRRVFDPYSGHSWASGTSPFADGNNQESSSEAVAAWNGLAVWASAVDDTTLESEARWMLAAETQSALSYWVDFDEASEPFAGFDRGVVGIVWDGKRDYGTWFSAEPAAILGIQLIPMSPVADYLGSDPDRIRANIAEATANGPAPQFADLLLMYQALAGPDDAAGALAAARELPDSAIDNGNSRTYLLAWIMAHA